MANSCSIVTCKANVHGNAFFYFCAHCKAHCPDGESRCTNCPSHNDRQTRERVRHERQEWLARNSADNPLAKSTWGVADGGSGRAEAGRVGAGVCEDSKQVREREDHDHGDPEWGAVARSKTPQSARPVRGPRCPHMDRRRASLCISPHSGIPNEARGPPSLRRTCSAA
eukprot:1642285-Prymnesium_polylepis.1